MTRHDSTHLKRHGTVLVVVLVIVTLVSLAAFHFTMAMESEHRATRNAGDQIKAEQAALSGIEVIAACLEQPKSRRGQLMSFQGVETKIWESRSGYIEDCWFTLSVDERSESARLNLYSLLEWDRRISGSAIRGLLKLPSMDERTANRILDWIDADDSQRIPGGEVNARNSVPLLTEELSVLADESEVGPNAVRGEPAWLDYLTVVSAERNETFDGSPRIYLNQGDLKLLHQQLLDAISTEFADYVIRFRQYGNADLLEASEGEGELLPIDFLVFPSRNFSSLGELIGSSVAVPSTSDSGSTLVQSPITLDGSYELPLDQMFDLVTVKSERRLSGRIDLSRAPLEVIAAVPGLDAQTAEQIVRVRGLFGQNRLVSPTYRHAIGILSSAGIDPTIVSQVLDKVTVRGDVIKAQVKGRSQGNVPAFLCEVMVDASDEKPRQLWVKRMSGEEARRADEASRMNNVFVE